MISSTTEELDTRIFESTKPHFLQQDLNKRQQNRNFKLFSSCRRTVSIDPIMWLPMSNAERNSCIRWRLGWLPGDNPRSCPKHPTQYLSKNHAIDCLTIHRCFFMPETIKDSLSFLMNGLPLHPLVPSRVSLSWSQRWPIICSILHELDQLHYAEQILIKYPHGQKVYYG